jgi:hypothetical protein
MQKRKGEAEGRGAELGETGGEAGKEEKGANWEDPME